jgi:hypothetical protein
MPTYQAYTNLNMIVGLQSCVWFAASVTLVPFEDQKNSPSLCVLLSLRAHSQLQDSNKNPATKYLHYPSYLNKNLKNIVAPKITGRAPAPSNPGWALTIHNYHQTPSLH